MRVSINIITGSPNPTSVCGAFAEGVRTFGDQAVKRSDRDFNMGGFDAVVFWGYWENCQKVEAAAREKGIPFIYVDLAYWRREQGYYKASLNFRHPTKYIMKMDCPPDRWDSLGLKIKPWTKDGSTVIVAGMSGKGAWSWKQAAGAYEAAAIAKLQELTKRRIIYRPKPNWHQAMPIAGSAFDRTTSIDALLRSTHCVVTHHSNVATDAIIAGVPVITRHSAALPMGLPDTELDRIETPVYPDGREQWAANLAYCQWTLKEMANGTCWRYMRKLIETGMAPYG